MNMPHARRRLNLFSEIHANEKFVACIQIWEQPCAISFIADSDQFLENCSYYRRKNFTLLLENCLWQISHINYFPILFLWRLFIFSIMYVCMCYCLYKFENFKHIVIYPNPNIPNNRVNWNFTCVILITYLDVVTIELLGSPHLRITK